MGIEYGLAVMAALSIPFTALCALADYTWRSAVPGSAGRYWWHSLDRLLRPFVLVHLIAAAAFGAVRTEWGWTIFSILLMAGFVGVRWRGDDEDDFWTGLSTRLKTRLTSGRSTSQPAALDTSTS